MIILTSDTSGTYKAQIRSDLKSGFKQLYTATCTMGAEQAAKTVVGKNFGPAAAETVKQIKSAAEIADLTGDFAKDAKRKQVFLYWSFDQTAKTRAAVIVKGKPATQKPLPLQGESTGPDWSRARAILQGIKTLVRLSLAGQVMLGHELQTLKVELGFAGRGGDRSKPKDSVLKSMNRTWEQWCNAELGISPDGADNFIKCFEAAKLKVKKLGGDKKLLGLMETHPSKLTKEDNDLLSGMVDKLLHGETQRQLLEELRIFKKAASLTGGDTANGKPKKTQLQAEQLAFAFFGKAATSITKLEKHIQNLRVAPDYQGFLHALPLHREGPDGLSLHTLKLTLEEAMTGDLPKMLADVNAAIAAAEKSAAA
jgi:hypothetical protein